MRMKLNFKTIFKLSIFAHLFSFTLCLTISLYVRRISIRFVSAFWCKSMRCSIQCDRLTMWYSLWNERWRKKRTEFNHRQSINEVLMNYLMMEKSTRCRIHLSRVSPFAYHIITIENDNIQCYRFFNGSLHLSLSVVSEWIFFSSFISPKKRKKTQN